MTDRLLVVEDTENILQVITVCLEANGYEVHAVQDGLAAVEETISWLPDLIVLDLLLPKMSGFLVLEALKQDLRTREIPVLVMSAKAQEEDIRRALTTGAADYLVKPFHPRDLVQRIQTILDIMKDGADQ
ncbi:MAG: response regulator transcription factor [Bacillota bacterium]